MVQLEYRLKIIEPSKTKWKTDFTLETTLASRKETFSCKEINLNFHAKIYVVQFVARLPQCVVCRLWVTISLWTMAARNLISNWAPKRFLESLDCRVCFGWRRRRKVDDITRLIDFQPPRVRKCQNIFDSSKAKRRKLFCKCCCTLHPQSSSILEKLIEKAEQGSKVRRKSWSALKCKAHHHLCEECLKSFKLTFLGGENNDSIIILELEKMVH